MNCPGSTDWLLYLADAAEPQAHQRLTHHLEQGCATCQAAVREARALMEQIPLAVEPVQPPDDARRRLMAQLEQTPQAPQPGTGPAGLWSWQRCVQWVSGCAAAAALAAGVTFLAMVHQVRQHEAQVNQLRQQVAQFDTQATQRDQQVQQLDLQVQQLMDIGADLFTTLRSNALQMIQFQGADEISTASMLWDRERNVVHFVGPSELESAGDRQYKLWIATEDDQILPVVTFKPDRFGQARFEVNMLEDYANMLDWVRISYEDADTHEEYLLAGDFPG